MSGGRVSRVVNQLELIANPTATADKMGKCLCGAVNVKVTGEPILTAICHCESCRKWTGSVGMLVNLYPEDKVTITGELLEFHKFPESISYRKVCAKCYGSVVNSHPGLKAQDVCGGIFEGAPHVPTCHIHYQETIFKIKDGLPKFKDMPKDLGGSGDMMSEA